MKYDCTVVVVTYNSDLNKLYSTLLSIIKQKSKINTTKIYKKTHNHVHEVHPVSRNGFTVEWIKHPIRRVMRSP